MLHHGFRPTHTLVAILLLPSYALHMRFLDMRKKFVQRTPDPSDRQRMRAVNFIEEIGLECALWPHLYW